MGLSEKMLPCQSREAIVTVSSYQNGIMEGFLRHPRLERREEFQSLSQMILILNGLLNLKECPNHPLPLICEKGDANENAAVFRIQILFREHCTWQGKLIWQNENQEAVFHSALELIQLIDEILAE